MLERGVGVNFPVAFLPSIGPVEALLLGVTAALIVWPACRICDRAGFPWTLGLLAMVPGLNLVLLLWLAFAEWPALRRRDKKADRSDRLLE